MTSRFPSVNAICVLVSVLFVAEAWAIKCPKGTTSERKSWGIKAQFPGEQTEVYCLDAEGLKHGPYRSSLSFERHRGGMDKEQVVKAQFHHGEEHGEWVTIRNGFRIARNYKDGKPHGDRTYWFKNGQLWSKSSYHEGNRHGRWQEWSAPGVKFSDGSYRHGVPVGKWQWFNLDGSLLDSFDMGEGDGLWREYNKVLLLNTIKMVGKEHFHGKYKVFKTKEGLYLNGKKHSQWTSWDDGRKHREDVYDRGKWVGECIYRDGKCVNDPPEKSKQDKKP